MWYVVVAVATTTCLLNTMLMHANNTAAASWNAVDNETIAEQHFNTSDAHHNTSFALDDEGAVGVEDLDSLGYKLGDRCGLNCYENLSHAFCNRTTKLCQCQPSHPIAVDDFICLPPVGLGGKCRHSQSCLFTDPYSTCVMKVIYDTKEQGLCSCKDDYRMTYDRSGRKWCARVRVLSDADIPNVFALGIGLALFTGLTCLVLRLFSRARFGQPRCRYANANLTPPIMMTGMSTPASIPASRRSSMRSGSTPGSRRPSYSNLVPQSRPGSRRPSVSTIRSQTSVRSYNRNDRNYDRGHDPLRLTMSAPPIRHDLHSPSKNIRILEQKFAQHSGYLPRKESQEKFDREWSRHSSFEIIADVISEAPEKA